ncbi:MAG: imidazoleglycerol-phosphate dehydratase HisB [Candidatus Hydrogenedentes bacterium]|jgi:imidazoleglycerol-phosphate dehydratase|nr:imidazoleglycerol-phosphate dehydratase HisB [Candidatus Hydrogenedentota bacterium]
MRKGEIARSTKETEISVSVDLDGEGRSDISTGVGFLDHMLTHLSKHGLFDVTVQAKGDLEIDGHHTVEDVGICLGQAFLQALGEPVGISRYGRATVPMDEALSEAVVDVSGRPYLVFNADLPAPKVGEFDVELAREFFQAFTMNSRVTLHMNLRYGSNVHHSIEGLFKAFARALREAVAPDPRVKGVPSTKGTLQA